MDQIEKAQAFAALHQKGAPLILYNVWDAGSADAVAKAGAQAVATGSWSVAAAQGFGDGEHLPMQDALRTARQIVEAVDLPVSVDFEGGYSEAAAEVAQNVAALVDLGVVGVNLEDRIVKGKGLHSAQDHAGKIRAIRQMAGAKDVPLFINARTDVFFQGSKSAPQDLMDEVILRAKTYAQAGASGLFVPGLSDLDLIGQLCDATDLPVNVMRMGPAPTIAALAAAGVSRISHGPAPYMAAMKSVAAASQELE